MSLIKYMPRPQKKRGNRGGDRQHILQDSKQSKSSLHRGRSIAQKFLKSTIYNKKMNCNEITMNLYTYKLNAIPGIIDEIIRCVVTDGPNIKRICFETGYGKPKKAIDIRKSCSHHLTVTLGYTADKSGLPKTFKFLSGDHANRLIIFPQNYAEYAQEQTEKQEKEQAIIDAKNSKKERKARKFRIKHFVHNKWKKNLKYPDPKKKRLPICDRDGEVLDSKLVTPGGGEDNDNVAESDDTDDGDSSSNHGAEETEEAFLRNFGNLQVMIQESKHEGQSNEGQENNKRRGKKQKKAKDVDIFKGVPRSEKFEYIDPDHQRYKKKPILNEGKQKQKKHNDPNSDWNCEFCSFKNSKHDDRCRSCYNESFRSRYNKFMKVVNANNKIEMIKGRNAENDNRYKWHCDECTFINTGDTDVCDMCGATNEEQEAKLDMKYENNDGGFFADCKSKRKVDTSVKHEEDYTMNGQIANVYRESHANVWKGYSDKHKQKTMRNGNKKSDGNNDKHKQKKSDGYSDKHKQKKSDGNNDNYVGFVPHKKQNVNNHGNKRNAYDNRNKKGNLSNRRKQKKQMRENTMQNNGNHNVLMNNMNDSKDSFVGFVPHKKQNEKRKQHKDDNKKKENAAAKTDNNDNYAPINFEWVDKLLNMGFEYDKAFDAVAYTDNVEFNDVLDHMMQNIS